MEIPAKPGSHAVNLVLKIFGDALMAQNEAVDVVLVGAGIMSATLAVLLKELDPAIKLEVVELMD